jgi:excisionase family DNA binding protein
MSQATTKVTASVKTGVGDTPEVGARVKEQLEIQSMYEKLRGSAAKLVGRNGTTETIPSNIYSFLCRILGDLTDGNPVTILQSDTQLTTVDASRLLGMSRQFLVTLLEKGEIPFFKVGTHRRLYARDVLAYKAKRDAGRRKALDDLARAEFEAGVYDKVPDDFHPGQRG